MNLLDLSLSVKPSVTQFQNDQAVAKTRAGDSSYYTMGMNVVTLQLRAGDDVWIRHIRESDSNYISGYGFPTFSGYLVEF